MDPLKKARADALAAAEAIIKKAKDENRDLNEAELTEVEAKHGEVEDLDKKIKGRALVASIGSMTTSDDDTAGSPRAAKSIGEHFAATVGAQMKEANQKGGRFSFATPEFKANTDVQDRPTLSTASTINISEVDLGIVPAYRRAPVIADLLGSGSSNAAAITYFVEGVREGNFAGVAEGGAKPQIHYVDPTPVTDAFIKIAAFFKTTDEQNEDLAFYVSEINRRAVYDLAIAEEAALLSGAGSPSLTGILNRSIGDETASDAADSADALFRAMTQVQVNSGLAADGLVIHPTDYQTLRLQKDDNNQYYGGGFFSGAYGVNSAVAFQPPVWGLRTVVTSAIDQGTALVGAFAQAATLYRKGGVRVESTNSHDDDFTNNLVTTRIEERIALAVRRPSAFVAVDLGQLS